MSSDCISFLWDGYWSGIVEFHKLPTLHIVHRMTSLLWNLKAIRKASTLTPSSIFAWTKCQAIVISSAFFPILSSFTHITWAFLKYFMYLVLCRQIEFEQKFQPVVDNIVCEHCVVIRKFQLPAGDSCTTFSMFHVICFTIPKSEQSEQIIERISWIRINCNGLLHWQQCYWAFHIIQIRTIKKKPSITLKKPFVDC